MGHTITQSQLTIQTQVCLIRTLEQGSPTPGPRTGSGLRPVRNWAAQQEVSGGQQVKLHLPLPIARITAGTTTSPLPPAVEKLSSRKLVPGAKKVGDRCSRVRQP